MEEYYVNVEPASEERMEEDCERVNSVAEDEMNERTMVEYIAVEGDVSLVPKVGMLFESEKAAQKFYHRYSKRLGFATKVKSSHVRKSSQELYHVLFTCNKEGFKRINETPQRIKPDTRVGCKARMRVKLTDSGTWKVSEVILDHNHLVCPSSAPTCASRKYSDARSKRRSLSSETGIRLGKSYKTLVANTDRSGNLVFGDKECRNYVVNQVGRLKLAEGDVEAIQQFFSQMLFKTPAFFYLLDLNKEGCLRNVFWADAGSRTAYGYFGDVVRFDTTYLTNKYDLPLALFVGVNHHGQSVLLGCGLLADDTTESYIWLFKAWLTSMAGRPPSAIITDQCKAIQEAVSKVFPSVRHRLCLRHILKKLPGELGELSEYKAIKKALKNAIYDSLRVDDFEMAWQNLIKAYGLTSNEWLQTLYEDRQRWVPVFVKDTFYAGMSVSQRGDNMSAIFDGYVHSETSMKEFFDIYELVLQSNYEKEAQADHGSFYTNSDLKSECCYEGQLAKLYTREIFKKFQDEVLGMFRCSNLLQVKVDGPSITYRIKERIFAIDGRKLEPKEYEVIFNSAEVEVWCMCRLFEHKGFLCRHALYVLNHNGVDDIPSRYILPRWIRDFRRMHFVEHGSSDAVVSNPVLRYDSLYQRAIKVVVEGSVSEQTYKVALQSLQEVLNKIRDANGSIVRVS
ncbi:hypothetical protein HHK36_006141 [Tetracentron sinense]|uniref:Protein FAR1-RELATED SEQUENCE n=1 Tax=Tetracentron sinense TaxID=13715 RepID=A0A834ZGW2_TETSI|nr:hypothetical protein HHK36_006141 [Tetracentron sinense]